jgi:dephospho-CoA kinase
MLRSKSGVVLVDADQVSRQVSAIGTEGLSAIIERFGEGFISEDGTLNRRSLGALVVNDQEARRDLESILHPLIAKSINGSKEEAQQNGVEIFVVEAALMVETGSYKHYDVLVVVSCDSDLQIQRLMEREGIEIDTAKRWIATQLPLGEKTKLADHIIANNGDFTDIATAVDLLLVGIHSR